MQLAPGSPWSNVRVMAAGADQGPGPVLVREGGAPYAPGPREDPFEALFELMEVVEALCPEWPVRKPDTRPGNFLL